MSGKLWRAHPWPRQPLDVYSCEELRFWLRKLYYDPAGGWSHCKAALARSLGLVTRQDLKSKLNQSWIYPGEQIRLSRQLDLILQGYIVPQVTRVWHGAKVYEGVYVDPPRPLFQTPKAWRVDITSKRPALRRMTLAPRRPTLPAFEKLFAGVKQWEPKRLPVRAGSRCSSDQASLDPQGELAADPRWS